MTKRSANKAFPGLPQSASRRPDPPHLQWVLSQLPPGTGDVVADQAALRALCPPIDIMQWDKCKAGMCEHHSPQALAWGHLLKQQHQATSASLASAAENSRLLERVRALDDENKALRAVVDGMHDAAPQGHQEDAISAEDSADKEFNYDDESESDGGEDNAVRIASLGRHASIGTPDNSIPDPRLHAAARAQTSQPVPTIEAKCASLEPKIVWVVIYRYDTPEGEGRCALKGVFNTLKQANDTAAAVLMREFPNCKYADIRDRGLSDDPWATGQDYIGNDIGIAQRRHTKGGEVRYAVDEEEDGNGYVAVLRQAVNLTTQS
ncbi:hypothetical protein LTR85_007753 [Meristemomyces frigidus]|nr:hypothetical protein LTR85_007753 [Meristemomyces frigidus]